MTAALARDSGYGAPASVIHADNSHPNYILVPDAQLLFTAHFSRAGPDLILTGNDGRHHIIPGYFSGAARPALTAPNGAALSADLVEILAGSPTPNEYAQAQPAPAGDPVGKVEKIVGNVTVTRNGVAVVLNVGDLVYKSDVIQTGSASQVGIGFPDGTALNLVANTRMALNDYSFDPNSTSNTAVISLVEGTFSFVAGKVAHSGTMKIETPVATMGIRGTTGWVQEQIATISANAGNATYSFAVTTDYGSTQSGVYDLIDQSGNVIATVSQTGYVTLVSPQGLGQSPVVSTQPMTPAQLQFEQQIVQQVFETLNLLNNANPQSGPGGSGSSPPQPQNNLIQQLIHENGSPFNFNNNGSGENGTTTAQEYIDGGPNGPTAVAYWTSTSSGNFFSADDWSDLYSPLPWQSLVIDPTGGNGAPAPVTVTVGSAGAAADLLVGPAATLAVISGGSLTISNITDVFGLLESSSTGVDPAVTLQGPVTVEGGQIRALGLSASVVFQADTVENLGTISAVQSGTVTFAQATVLNTGGTIAADAGGTVMLAGDIIVGGILTLAAASIGQPAGRIDVTGTTAIDDATIQSAGTLDVSGTLTLDGATLSGGQISDHGLIQIAGPSVLSGDATLSGGPVTVESRQSLTLDGATLSDAVITFAGVSGYAAVSGFTPRFIDNAGAVVGTDPANEAVIFSNGVISTVDDPAGVATRIYGSNNAGIFVGTTLDAANAAHGFIDTGGTFTAINDPSAGAGPGQGTTALSIDNNGGIAGFYVDSSGVTHGFVSSVVLQNNTPVLTFATLDDPSEGTGANHVTKAIAVNDLGQVLGSFVDNNGDTNGFIYSNGNFSTLDVTGATSTTPIAMNDLGQVIGNYKVGGVTYGFLYSDGAFTTLSDPSPGASDTTAVDINDAGQVVGTYVDNSGEHGFLYSAGRYTTIDDASGGSLTALLGINDSGQILGEDADGTSAFVFTLPTLLLVDAGDTGTISDTTLLGGTVDVEGAGSYLDMSGSTVRGSTLSTGPVIVNGSGDTIAVTADSGTAQTTFDGSSNGAITVAGDIVVAGGAQLDLIGTIHVQGSDGQIQVGIPGGTDVSGTAAMLVDGTVTLDGGNQVSLWSSATGAAEIVAAADGGTLKNSDTIYGSGTIGAGDGALKLVNLAGGRIEASLDTINATPTTGTLLLDADNKITNLGTLAALHGGTLEIENSTIDNSNDSIANNVNSGVVEAETGSFVALQNAEILHGSVTIDQGGELYTVAGPSNSAVDDDTINTANGSFNPDNPPPASVTIASGGTLQVSDNSALDLVSPVNIENSGTIKLGANATLDFDQPFAVLDGGGTVTLADQSGGPAHIDVAKTGDQVTNLNNDISLAGEIGDSGMALVNDGTITADGVLTLDPKTLVNAGTLSATGGGTLVIETTVTNTDGTIAVDGIVPGAPAVAASTLELSGASISGGTINDYSAATVNSGTVIEPGLIEVAAKSSVTGADLNNGDVTVEKNVTLTLDNVTVSGTAFTDTASGAILAVDGGDTLTLSGVSIDGGAINGVDADAPTMTAASTIDVSGDSTIDDSATISDGDVTISGVTLTLDNVSATGVTFNDTASGSIIALDGGTTLTLSGATIEGGAINGTATSGGAGASTISVTGDSVINGNAAITDGDIKISGATLTLDNVTLSGVAIDATAANSFIKLDGNTALSFDNGSIDGGTVQNGGTIQINQDSALTITGTVTLDDGGTVDLMQPGSGHAAPVISGYNNGAQPNPIIVAGALDNADNLIEGTGAIGNAGDGSLTFDNEESGTVNANIVGSSIVIDTGNTATNAGRIEATNGGTLQIDDNLDNADTGQVQANGGSIDIGGTVTSDTHGTVEAEAGSVITLESGTISGGEVFTAAASTNPVVAAGEIVGGGSAGSAIDNAIINNSGELVTGGTFTLDGDTVNGGILTGDATGASFNVDSGTLTLNGVTAVADDDTIATLQNSAAVKLEKSFTLSPSTNPTSTAFTLDLTGAGSIALEAGLIIAAAAANEELKNDGNIISGIGQVGDGNDSYLSLDNNAGTVEASGGLLTFDTGNTVTNAGLLEAASGATLDLFDSVDNTGTTPTAAQNAAGILVSGTLQIDGDSTVELTGKGTVALAGGTIENNGTSGTYTLENVDNTISGDGAVSHGASGTFVLLNDQKGNIDADVSGQTLTVDTGNTVTNAGTLEATKGGTLQLADNIDNSAGTIEADGGSTITLAGVTIDGGTINGVNAAGMTAASTVDLTADSTIDDNATITNGDITLDGFKLTLDNVGVTGVTFDATANNSTIDVTGDSTIDGVHISDGVLDVTGVATALMSSGTSLIDGVSVTNAGIIEAVAGVLTLSAGSLVNEGTLAANGGTLVVDENVTGSSGHATIAEGGTLEFEGSVAAGQTVTFQGSDGILYLTDPAAFQGEIAGISGTGDIIDLSGYDTSASVSPATGPNDTTTLTITDANHATLTFTLAGDLSGDTWTVAEDNAHSGIDIADPPPALTADSFATAGGAAGTLAEADSSGAVTASFTAYGSNYLGTFSLNQASVVAGDSIVSWEFDFDNQQVTLAPGETLTQSYNVSLSDTQNAAASQSQTVSVTVGGPGNDNFVFAPGIGADTVVNFNAQQSTLELDHFSNAQTVQELQALIAADTHGDAVIDLGHNDSLTLAGVTPNQLQQVIAAGHVLLH